MKERGIPYSPAMVIARNDGTKTQTRRIAKIDAPAGLNLGFRGLEATHLGGGRWAIVSRGAVGAWEERAHAQCPYGVVGDRLYSREAYRFPREFDHLSPAQVGAACVDAGYRKPWAPIRYEADGATVNWEHGMEPGRYRHARFMPRWASRGLDEITDIRLQRLQCISEADALAEGIQLVNGRYTFNGGLHESRTAVESYRALWELINGIGSWGENPLVFAITFRRIAA